MTRKRKNYPGDLRLPGSKDFGLILSNLIKYRNELLWVDTDDEILSLLSKIAEKLQELGYAKESASIRRKAKSANNLSKKKNEAIALAVSKWKEGKALHEATKKQIKEAKKLERKNKIHFE